MEKVKDLILYQVATDRNYKVGDIIKFNKKTNNGMFERVYNTTFLLNNIRLADELYACAERKFKKFKNKEDIYQIAHKLQIYDVLVKELAIEEVRQIHCPDFPSRLHCMYLSLNKDIVLKNIVSMANNPERNGKHFQAIAVKLNGKIFKAGKVYMSREGQSYNYYKNKALKYWQQDNLDNSEVKEILFEGTAEVVEILDEITNK